MRLQSTLVTAKADYKESMLADQYMITTLTPMFSVANYNVLSIYSGEHVVVFANQPSLMEMLRTAPNALFLVRLLKPEAKYFKYTVQMDGVDFEVRTIGELGIILNPTDEEPVDLTTSNEGNILVK